MRFEVGNIVKISRKSQYYTDDADGEDPMDVTGEITDTDDRDNDECPIRVVWDNGCGNIYPEKDLRLVRR